MKNWILVLTVAIGLAGCGKHDSQERAKEPAGEAKPSPGTAQGEELPATPVARPDAGRPERTVTPEELGTARGAKETGTAKPGPGAEPKPDVDLGGEPADACVTDCVRRNQMRAVGPEQIESDCRAECAKKGK